MPRPTLLSASFDHRLTNGKVNNNNNNTMSRSSLVSFKKHSQFNKDFKFWKQQQSDGALDDTHGLFLCF
jgi:hypothetical protein